MQNINMTKLTRWTALAAVAALAFWLILAQGWAITLLQDRVKLSTGRELVVTGGAHLEIANGLAVRLDDVTLSNPERMDDVFISAKSLRLEVGLWGLLRRKARLAEITLESPVVRLTIDELGRTSWPQEASPDPAALRLHLRNSRISFLDQRNGQGFAFDGASMVADISAAGELTLTGSARIGSTSAQLDAYVKDISRLTKAGSPAELVLTAPTLNVAFSGRLSTADVLGLVGHVTVSGSDLRRALAWMGAAPGGDIGLKNFALEGALDAKGRAFAVRQASVRLDTLTAQGNIELDMLGAIPKFNALLDVGVIDLDSYIPASGWLDGDWGKSALGYSALRGLEAGLTFSTTSLNYRGLQTGPAKIAATLSEGKLEAQIASQVISEARVTLDGSGAIPAFALALKGDLADAARLLAPLAGLSLVDGKGSLTAEFSAHGQTQQEMIATLQGEAEMNLTAGAVNAPTIKTILPPGTAFTALNASLAAADGIIAVKSLSLNGPSSAITATGEIDLLRQALELRVSTATTGAHIVKGPWTEPKINSDVASPYPSGTGN